MPMLLNRWSITEKKGTNTNQADYAMYIAPLVKTGFDTSLNGLNQTQQQGSTPSSVKPVGTSAQFYKFYDYGFRLGHYQLSKDPAHAPDALSFLDVSFGRFSNMASLLCPLSENNGDGTCGSSTVPPTLSWAHDYRINVEGLLEIPGTSGFSVGFSTNVAAHSAPHSVIDGITYVHLRPADDLRFLFAYKFDITKLLGKLASKPSS